MNKNYKVQVVWLTYWLLRNWLAVFLILFGIFNLLPFLAPVAARLGFGVLADLIYALYAPFCHQMANRSFFLFGDQLMYSPEALPLQLTNDLPGNMLALKQFTGSDTIGWKVAWSDRMVYMYGALWLFAAIYGAASRRHQVKRVSILTFILLMLPMIVDGTTHMLSDFGSGGLVAGFRYTNGWLADLTDHTLPLWFYRGDALGSFNSWMRLISGIGFGAAIVAMTFPLIAREMQYSIDLLAKKLHEA